MNLKYVNEKTIKYHYKKIALIVINHYAQNVGINLMILLKLFIIIINKIIKKKICYT